MLLSWKTIPFHLDPVILDLGFFQLRWYGLMYLVAFGLTWVLVNYRLRREEFPVSREELADLFFWAVVGVVLGGRLGFVLFYDPGYFLAHPLEIFSPFRFRGGFRFVGISGMSYHGGMLGVLTAFVLFCHRRNLDFRRLGDLFAPAIPLGYTFGRLANFINGELYGRQTTVPWGMIFPDDPQRVLRHPSQLYEAGLEGLLLFAVLWGLRRRITRPGLLTAMYIMGYGLVRFLVEYTREPDPHLGLLLGFSEGQWLSLGMISLGLGLWYWSRGKTTVGS